MHNDANIRAVITADDQASAVLKNFGASLDSAQRGSQALLKGVTLAGAAIGALGVFGVKSAADLQTASQSMTVLSGSAADANRVIGQLYQFVLGKPITFPDAAQAAKTLMGYGVTATNVVDDVEALSKISITTGANLGQVALAFGQVNAKGKLMGQETLQLVNNSIPITNILAKELGLTIQETAAQMEGGGISAQVFNKALLDYSKTLDISQFGSTLQNRLISLKGSLRALAFTMLGIKIDPIKGFVIQAGGLFDDFSRAVDFAAKNLKQIPAIMAELQPWFPVIIAALVGGLTPAFIAFTASVLSTTLALAPLLIIGASLGLLFKILVDNGVNPLAVAVNYLTAAWNFLQPSLLALWKTFETQLLPSLQRLWVAISPTLVPALAWLIKLLGEEIVIALYIFINSLNISIGVIAKFIDWVRTATGVTIQAFTFAATMIVAPFRYAFNQIAALWNGTVGRIHFTAPDWVPGIGGKQFGIPSVPLLAQGGIVTKPTLAMIGEAGPEAVVPLGKAGNMGTVNITIQAQAFMGNQVEARKFAEQIVDHMNDIAGKKNMTAAQMLGAS